MIYVKKPDGTIIQHDTKDAQQMRQALQIDQQLAAQKGEEFGNIYDADSLPDEDKVRLGLIKSADHVAKLKAQAYAVISSRSRSERAAILDDQTMLNILSGATTDYPAYLTVANVAKMIERFKSVSKQAKADIKAATTKAGIDAVLNGLAFPTEAEIVAEAKK